MKTCRKQGERCQHWATYLRSLKTLTLLDILAWPKTLRRGEVEPSGVDAHERGGVLLVVDTAPALAEGAGVELTGGGAEKAMIM